MTNPLKVQEPGESPAIDSDKLAQLAEGNVGDLAEAVDDLNDDELAQLAAIEMAGKARTTALGAIAREQERRALDADLDPESPAEVPTIGDASSYARMRAAEINPGSLSSPVLTLDGWLLPSPSASPEG